MLPPGNVFIYCIGKVGRIQQLSISRTIRNL
jgi:hypothetical protein